MLTKSTFARRENEKLWFVTQYRLFGFLMYQKAIEEPIAPRSHQFI